VIASRSGQSSHDPYDLSSDDEEYVMSKNVAETTPRQSEYTAHLLQAPRLYLKSPPELPQNWWQLSLNHHDYHTDHMEISNRSWIADVTHWWHPQ
jgi:hypothetical protein